MLQIDRVSDSPVMPTDVDVIIIGGGIIGTTSAYELARQGVSVALVEKGFIGAEQSGRNWGWVRQQNRRHDELVMAMRSLTRWSEIGNEIGRDLGFRRQGSLYGTTVEADVARWEKWAVGAKAIGYSFDLLSAAELKSRIPTGTARWVGGLWSPSDGLAEPGKAAPAIAEGAKGLGAYVLQTCAARGFDISAGRITGVWTERGLIRAATVVCAGGAWSSRLLKRHGVELPVANVVGTAMRTSQVPALPGGTFNGPGFALRRRLDGGYTLAVPGYGRVELAPQGMQYALKFYRTYRSALTKKLKIRIGKSFFHGPEASASWALDDISPFERIRVLEPAIDEEWLVQAVNNLTTCFPQMKGVRILQAWAGLIDTTPDLVPVISTVDEIPGLIVASGFSGHGFGLGPGAGLLVSEMAQNKTTYSDITPFSLNRFKKGGQLLRPEMM
jgi:glycine/D-amino acid oxidase-like deaminating enzyme